MQIKSGYRTSAAKETDASKELKRLWALYRACGTSHERCVIMAAIQKIEGGK